jgi:hypothetical protein
VSDIRDVIGALMVFIGARLMRFGRGRVMTDRGREIFHGEFKQAMTKHKRDRAVMN